MTDHVVTRNIVLKLPKDMAKKDFNSCTQRWDAEGQLARDFLPVLKAWLLDRNEKHAAFSLDHVFSNIIMINIDQKLADMICQKFTDQVAKISKVEDKKTAYVPASAVLQAGVRSLTSA